MKHWIDEKDLKQAVCHIHMDETARQRISKVCESRNGHGWYYKRKCQLALILTALTIIFLCSPAAAEMRLTLEMWLSRMTEQEIKDIYDSVQKSETNSNRTSRELSWNEKLRKDQLKARYNKGEIFPEAPIVVLGKGAQPISGRVCYDETESVWLLPSAELTDEELLEIIDYERKMDYSLDIINDSLNPSEKPAPPVSLITEAQALEAARDLIGAAYEIETDTQRMFVDRDKNGFYSVKYTGLEQKNGYIANCYILVASDTGKVDSLTYFNRDHPFAPIPADKDFDGNRWYEKGWRIVSSMADHNRLKAGYYMAYYTDSSPPDMTKRIHYFYELENGHTYHLGFLYESGVLQILSSGQSFSEHKDDYEQSWKQSADRNHVKYKTGRIE